MTIANFINRRIVEPQVRKHREEGRVQGIAEGRDQGIAEGRDQGIAEGRDQGIAEGQAQANRRWSEWNRRHREAEAYGKQFDDPPPDETGQT